MKFNIKHWGICMLLGTSSMVVSSCNDLLDLEPVNQITPEAYYSSADQLASYLNYYYNDFLTAPYSIGAMYHNLGWSNGLIKSDNYTDLLVAGDGSTQLFANDHWEVNSGKALQGYYGNVRICNYFLEKAISGYEAGSINGSPELIKNYIGEGYFFRALCYFRMLANFGDVPIISEVLEDKDDILVANSQRAPRNEVARFILQDLDNAIAYLANCETFGGQRLNKEAALLFKSRVALFEATFEKYHKGSGRVPGDANWPGAKMAYNSGKTFNIDSDIDFFLTEAMNAAKQVADAAGLTPNNHIIEPGVGTITGWNPYFEMYSQPSLRNVSEVLLWKQYDKALGISHGTPYRTKIGANDGYTRAFAESFLMTNGLPIYATGSGYQGDITLDDVKNNRDERLQLFIWGNSTIMNTDPAMEASLQGEVFTTPNIITDEEPKRSLTGYQARKYYTYDYSQTSGDQVLGTNACPIFRSAEAMLNYMEACYEKNGNLDGIASGYWRQLRERAGVNTDFNATIAATDLDKEGDWGVYSGAGKVNATLYNIRRERMNETFGEGLRFSDLIRWRSFDHLMTTKWIPEGCNFWDELYTSYDNDELIDDGTSNAKISSRTLSKYLRPFSRVMSASNELRDGYTWHEAYYLYPLGVEDLRTASSDRDLNTSNMYQNINWPAEAGGHALK